MSSFEIRCSEEKRVSREKEYLSVVEKHLDIKRRALARKPARVELLYRAQLDSLRQASSLSSSDIPRPPNSPSPGSTSFRSSLVSPKDSSSRETMKKGIRKLKPSKKVALVTDSAKSVSGVGVKKNKKPHFSSEQTSKRSFMDSLRAFRRRRNAYRLEEKANSEGVLFADSCPTLFDRNSSSLQASSPLSSPRFRSSFDDEIPLETRCVVESVAKKPLEHAMERTSLVRKLGEDTLCTHFNLQVSLLVPFFCLLKIIMNEFSFMISDFLS